MIAGRGRIFVAAAVALVLVPAAHAAEPESGVVLSYLPYYRDGIDEMPLERLTHLVYAFVEHGPDGRARPRADDVAFAGRVAALRARRDRAARPRLLLGVGGAGDWSAGFAGATVPARRGAAARSLVALMRRVDFDGIDVDWESPRPGTAEPAAFVAYLAALRRELDRVGARTGRRYTLSADVGFLVRDPFNAQAVDMTPPRAARSVDLWNVMAYEMRGAWNCTPGGGGTGFAAALHPRAGDPFVRNGGATAIAAWRAAGVPAAKLVLGVPFTGTAFSGVPPGPRGNGVGQACDPGRIRQVTAVQMGAMDAAAGYRSGYDARSEAAYRYSTSERTFLSLETPRSIAAKRRFARREGLAGAMAWDIGADAPRFTLLGALSPTRPQRPAPRATRGAPSG